MPRKEDGAIGVTLGLLLACAALGGCIEETVRTPEVPAPPPVPPPVVCTEQPLSREVAITCRYYHDWQQQEVWGRSVRQASVVAVSLGFTHAQWLASETRPETVKSTTPVDCRASPAWGGPRYNCYGGNVVEQAVSFLAITRFGLLTADEAAARAKDPLVPPERRPFDARATVAPPAAPPR